MASLLDLTCDDPVATSVQLALQQVRSVDCGGQMSTKRTPTCRGASGAIDLPRGNFTGSKGTRSPCDAHPDPPYNGTHDDPERDPEPGAAHDEPRRRRDGGDGMGRPVRRAGAADPQLLPLPGGRRARGRGPDLDHLREGLAPSPPLPEGPRRVHDLALHDRAPGGDRPRTGAAGPQAPR